MFLAQILLLYIIDKKVGRIWLGEYWCYVLASNRLMQLTFLLWKFLGHWFDPNRMTQLTYGVMKDIIHRNCKYFYRNLFFIEQVMAEFYRV